MKWGRGYELALGLSLRKRLVDTSSNLVWLSRQVRPNSSRIAFSLILALLSGVLSTVDPLLMRRLIDYALPQHRVAPALLLALAIGGCFLGRYVFLGWSRSIDFSVQQDLAQTLRVSVLEQMNRLSPDYHETTPVGEKLRRLESDVDQIAEFGADVGSWTFQASIFFVINLAVMFRLSAGMALALLPTIGLFWWVCMHYRRHMEQRSGMARLEAGRASSVLLEFLSAQPQIQLLGSQKLVEKKALTIWTRVIHARKAQRHTEIFFAVAINSVFALANLLVLGVGGLQVLHGTLTIGGLVAFYTFTTRTFEPVNSMLDIYSRLKRAGACMITVRDVLESEPKVADFGTITDPRRDLPRGITFNDVSFSYTPDRTALRNVDLRIGALDRVGIVGPSGSGKSTLGRLLARMADPQTGEISLDGYSLREYTLEALRRTICYVPQNPVLFQGSVRENLLYGNRNASPNDLDRVVSVTQLDQVVKRLQNGLDCELGPNGHSLSGGELQRLALARALLREAPVLVLDESTSALDLPTEQRVLESLANFCSQSTLIIISHRLASISWMSRIVVMNGGQMVASGTHDDLYSESPFYRRLYENDTPIDPADLVTVRGRTSLDMQV